MTRRTTSRSRKPERDWGQVLAQLWKWLTSPLAQQILAILLGVLAILTLLPLLGLPFTSGRWLDAWTRGLQFVFGWGVIPVAGAIGALAVLIMMHHLDQSITWRWRWVVGGELVFFSLLALTHLLAQGLIGLFFSPIDGWSLVESGWAGGVVGWALAEGLGRFIGPWGAGMLMLLLLLLGLGMAFDLTLEDVKAWLRGIPASRPSPVVSHPSPAASRPAPAPSSPPVAPRPAPAAARPSPAAPTAPVATRPAPAATPPLPAAARPAPVAPPTPIPLAPAVLPEALEMPPLELLQEAQEPVLSDKEVREKSRIITETLAQFGLPVEVIEVRRGPTVTQFGIAPGFAERGSQRRQKVRVSQIASLANDLALALAAPSLRVEAPVPGRSVVGIEVPNEQIGLVTLRSVMESEAFRSIKSPLAFALGEDVAGSPVAADLTLMPHLLIAGTTGSGKSVCIKALAVCLAFTNRPDELRMVMIDPKMVELSHFRGLPHLLGQPEVELERIVKVLRWVAHEMDRRYKEFAAISARHLDDYNQKMRQRAPEKRLPRIIVLIDELADLMMLAPEETERTICRIAQMARATGIHLVVATQRPSTDVVTGLIKANFPARISFATASQIDSRVILDMPGAETLLGRGDMLYLASDAGHPVRVQGCYVSEEEIERLVRFWQQQTPGWPVEAPWESMVRSAEAEGASGAIDEDEEELLQQAIALLRQRKTISASWLQRELRIGYPRAARLIEILEERGLVGPQESAGRPRYVIGGDPD